MISDFLRYSCQIALPGFEEKGQTLLQRAKVLIVGAGGLGCAASQYLTATGIGTIGIADFDTVNTSNLHRQVLYTPEDVGKKKVITICERLQKQNPGIELIAHDIKVSSQNVMDLIGPYDIIIDGTDNFESRYLLNDAAVIAKKPVVYGAIYQYEGQLAVWNVLNENGTPGPNYRDLFPKVDASQIPNCAEGGVIPTIAGIIGCMQANEVIKYLTKTGELIAGKFLVFDALTMQSRIIKMENTTGTHITRLIETVDAPTVTVSQLKVGIEDNTIVLIDVRSNEEREEFNIGGEHIPFELLYNQIDTLDKVSTIIFYCATGKRSGEAVKLIKKRYSDANVFSLDGGLKKWIEAVE